MSAGAGIGAAIGDFLVFVITVFLMSVISLISFLLFYSIYLKKIKNNRSPSFFKTFILWFISQALLNLSAIPYAAPFLSCFPLFIIACLVLFAFGISLPSIYYYVKSRRSPGRFQTPLLIAASVTVFICTPTILLLPFSILSFSHTSWTSVFLSSLALLTILSPGPDQNVTITILACLFLLVSLACAYLFFKKAKKELNSISEEKKQQKKEE